MPAIADAVVRPMNGTTLMRHLEICIAAALDVMATARRFRHKSEQARLLISASEHLRRCLETAHRLVEDLWTLEKIDEFHRHIIDCVRRYSPDAANEILAKIEEISATAAWGNGHARN